MAQLNIPNTIDVNTTADAVEVEQNFNVIQSWVNHDAVRRDGGVAMDAPLLLNAGDPTEDNHAANKNYVDALMPIGTIMMFGGNNAPAGAWHLCDGTLLAVASYPVLYGQLGVRYGGSGGTFNLPNFVGRMAVGMQASVSRFSATGKSGGSWVVPVPSHTHGIDHNHPVVTTSVETNHTHTGRVAALAEAGTSRSIYTDPDNPGTTSTMTGGAGNHSHTVDVPNFDGTSGAFEKKVNLNLETNNVLITPIVETTTEHLPPFVVVQYIIRVDPQ